MEQTAPKKRGRPAKLKPDVQQQIVETIKEIFVERIVEIPEKKLEGFDLYKALKDSGFFQGGIGQTMESPLSSETVYIPHASEIYGSFAQNPDGWATVRDYLARAYLELNQ